MSQKLTFSIEEVVIETGISRTYIYDQIRAGRLKAVKAGRRTYVRSDDLHSFIDGLPALKPKPAA